MSRATEILVAIHGKFLNRPSSCIVHNPPIKKQAKQSPAQRLLDLLKLRLLEELLLLDRLLDRLTLLSLAFSLTIFSFSAARSSCLFQ